MCQPKQDTESGRKRKIEQPFRVAKETYDLLQANYTSEYSCLTKNVTKDVCVCPKGFTNFDCANAEYSKCFLNITNPPFY